MISLTRSRKSIAGLSMIVTASAFMVAAYGTVDRVPLPILVVYLTAIIIGGALLTFGNVEERKLSVPRNYFS